MNSKNLVTLALLVSGLGLGYASLRPAHAHVAHVREPVSTTVLESASFAPAEDARMLPEYIAMGEVTIVAAAPRKAARLCEHTENRLGGSITSFVDCK